MDGTRADRIVDGHLDRPASMSVIIRDYPEIVIGLISGQYSVSYAAVSKPDGARNISVVLPRYATGQFILREEDFVVCQNIAELFTQNKGGPGPISAFLSEPIQDLKSRIAAHLRVEFVGRGT